MNRLKVIYDGWDPTREHVTHICIQTETTPPYVFRTYGRFEELPPQARDMMLVTANAARNVFDFQKGTIADVVQN